MYLQELTLYHFRNLSDQRVSFSPGINFILGKNGQGKTNLVEAIEVLAIGKSFRTTHSKELIGWNQKEASVFGVIGFKEPGSEERRGVTIKGEGKKYFAHDQEVRLVREFVGRVPVVAFSPDDLTLIKGAPQERRRFLDRHGVSVFPHLIDSLSQYQKALAHKQRLLKDEQCRIEALAPWNELIAELVVEINSARKKFLLNLKPKAQEIIAELCPVEGIELSLDAHGEDEIRYEKELYFNYLMDKAGAELRTQSALYGIHRDDLLVTLNGAPARAFASQGQIRSIVLALTLALIRLLAEARGEAPLVLLDDVNSELDRDRAGRFFTLLLAQKSQLFITGTDLALSQQITSEGEYFRVENGVVTKEVTS